MEEHERQYNLQIIRDGSKSEYWKLIKGILQQWANEESKILDSYKFTGVGKDKRDIYNRHVDRLEYLNKLLTINEVMIRYNESVLEKIKETVYEGIKKVESFVRK